MKRCALAILGIALLIFLAGGAWLLAGRAGWLRPDEQDLRARYALPQSRFPVMDGQRIHLVDEGRGIPILLVHGSYASLRMWDDWASALRHDHRVIRFDRSSMGLSGPDPKGRYGAEVEAALIGRIADQLGLQRFFLVSTSSAGEAAAAYAGAHPDRLLGVIFANIAAGPVAYRPIIYPWWFRATLWIEPHLNGWHLPLLWKGVLEHNFADPARVTPALIREWTDLNNRAQGWPRQPRPVGYVPFARTPGDLAKINVPALLLWSDRDPEVPLAVDGRAALQRLGSHDKALVVVPNCGHMMPIECGLASVAIARRFFNAH